MPSDGERDEDGEEVREDGEFEDLSRRERGGELGSFRREEDDERRVTEKKGIINRRCMWSETETEETVVYILGSQEVGTARTRRQRGGGGGGVEGFLLPFLFRRSSARVSH